MTARKPFHGEPASPGVRLLAPLLVIAILLPGCADLRGPGSDAKVVVRSWALVRDEAGTRLVGEVANQGVPNADAIRVVAEFYDANGTSLGQGIAPAWRRVLEENETSPFDAAAPRGAVRANVSAIAETTRAVSSERQHLEPRDVRTTQPVGSDVVAFQGTAYNAGDLTVVGVEAQLTFRDAAGRVVGVARAPAQDAAIRAHEGSPFRGNATLARDFLRYDVVVVTTG